MVNYLIRRLLLMIPTLLGITFLVFCLLALAPGGIGAAIQGQGGGDRQAASQVALQEAYLEDRYGLDDPVIVQYSRWLARVSPVKLGQRDQWLPRRVDGQGQLDFELIRAPKPIKAPLVWQWFTDQLPPVPAPRQEALSHAQGASEKDQLDNAGRYRTLERAYFDARYKALQANAELQTVLIDYARELQIPGGVDDIRIRPNQAALIAFGKKTDAKRWPEVQAKGQAAVQAFRTAVQAFADLDAFVRLRLFDEAGVGIPGLISLATPDLGTAFSKNRPVSEIMYPALVTTISMNLLAIPIIYLVAVPSGVLAATKRGSFFDTGLGTLYVALVSVPVLLAGTLAIGFLASKEYLNAFPVAGLNNIEADNMPFLPMWTDNGAFLRGWLLDRLWHMALPVLCLVYGGFALLSKQTRAAMLENFSMDYVRTAKAKGVAPRDVIFRHVFRNSLLPLITIFVTVFPAMLAGSIVVERVFSIPGMGFTLLEAIANRDAEVILANTVMVAGVNLLALLLADVLYALADPRVTYD